MCPAVGQNPAAAKNDQQQDHGWVCAAQTTSCRAAGTTHSSQAASTNLTLGISAICSQDCRLQEPQETSTELSSWLDLQLALGLLLCICTSPCSLHTRGTVLGLTRPGWLSAAGGGDGGVGSSTSRAQFITWHCGSHGNKHSQPINTNELAWDFVLIRRCKPVPTGTKLDILW